VPRRDRLLGLSGCRLALRQAGLATPESVLAATPELRRRYRHCFGEALRLVERRHPDVMLALFWSEARGAVGTSAQPMFAPRNGQGPHGGVVDWQAAILGNGTSVERMLFVDRGPIGGARAPLLLVTYRIDGDGEGEREARRALVTTLRASS
jgi:hypothetical protein